MAIPGITEVHRVLKEILQRRARSGHKLPQHADTDGGIDRPMLVQPSQRPDRPVSVSHLART